MLDSRRSVVGAVLLGVACTSTGSRAIHEFHDRVRTGMSVLEIIQVLDDVYTREPRAWTFVTGWGSSQVISHSDLHKARNAGSADDTPESEPITWYGDKKRTRADLESAAAKLSKAKQLWFTFRSWGYLHLSITLDDSRRVLKVNEVSGHAD
jgi:hypothetical protein